MNNTDINAHIVGWAHTPFGKHPDATAESMIAEVAADAIASAGLEPGDVDEVFVGMFNNGMSMQDFPSSLVFEAVPELRFKPATRLENACASGSAALFAGVRSIQANRGGVSLVIGVEKMTDLPSDQVADVLLKASYIGDEIPSYGGFPGIFGYIADRYADAYSDPSDAMAAIAAKNHRHGVDNPLAHMRRDFGYEFCRNESDKNPTVAGRLKRTDCALITDGAAAVVLASPDRATDAAHRIGFLGAAHVNDLLPLSGRDATRFEGAERAWQQALGQAGVGIWDLDGVELHDCFTMSELIQYESMGITEAGHGATAIHEGWTTREGRLPVNVSGGLKAKGHPVGATGVSMHVHAAMQLAGTAGAIQLDDVELFGVFNMGGASVANYATVLEAVR